MTTETPPGDKSCVYLKPGELFVSRLPAVVTTVLGSCVSVTFFHRFSGVAAICHAMQPRCSDADRCPGECPLAGRYAVCAVDHIVRQIMSVGLRPRDIDVKLFGGAAMMGTAANPLTTSMGRQNVVAAMETISRHGLILKVADVGGTFGRKIIFDTGTGEVLLKRLKRPVDIDVIS